jgi:copper chaperone CopZ
MHCEACTALIEETLHERSGVISAEVDLGDSRAVVRYDPSRLGPEDLRDSIADAGYTATVVS